MILNNYKIVMNIVKIGDRVLKESYRATRKLDRTYLIDRSFISDNTLGDEILNRNNSIIFLENYTYYIANFNIAYIFETELLIFMRNIRLYDEDESDKIIKNIDDI